MNWKAIFKIQGILLIIIAASMCLPLAFSLYYRSGDGMAFVKSIAITLGAGLLLALVLRPVKDLRTREGFIIVSLGWLFAALFGSLPFLFSGVFGTNFVDCFFETMSGFTTTGATVLQNIEAAPRGLLFWRSLTHWLGGMGIILLAIIILPTLGLSSTQLFRAEVPGPAKEKVSPKIKNTALILWGIYLGLTIAETLLLMLGGLDLYTALCHTFGTLATGGFSTLNASIAGFHSLYVEMVILVFMFLAGTSFILHFSLIKGRFSEILHNREWRFYSLLIFTSILIATLSIYFSRTEDNFWTALRYAAFQVVSITTTTGYVTANFELWPAFVRILLIFLMFAGGCSGSTGGGMKQIRLMIGMKFIGKEIKKATYPNAKFTLKLGSEKVSDDMLKNVIAFILLFVMIFALGTLFLTFRGYDIVTAFSASVATLSNIGPGLSRVGAVENYAFFDNISKVVLSFFMLLGRLELYSVLILFYYLLHPRKIY
ncbi:MAG: potassium transporter TrkG [Candidatus Neomarinimicrobiota bacterium]|jgi:trk system potassium uptake protein TrkH|nr:potassium transporter TrkG [Candidatus Neomarinimicrobiota bacterium]MDD3965580.1 potassium transporter TrkG [Candidatus Neomarinimicrobiota bacterium]MDX9779438.1 potassium transporter TrkG [bacterium]